MTSITDEEVDIHIKIPRKILDELTKRAEQKRISRTELIEDSLKEHLHRIKTLENIVAVKEKELQEINDEIQPSKDMIESLFEDLLQQNPNISFGWEYERISRFLLRALTRFGHLYCPIDSWRKIKAALPPGRRFPFSQFTDYEQLCRILYPADPFYFERCLQNNKPIYLVKAK